MTTQLTLLKRFAIRLVVTLGGGHWLARRLNAKFARVQANLRAAQGDYDEFTQAVHLIEPLMQQRPDWTARDAIEHLRARGVQLPRNRYLDDPDLMDRELLRND